MVMKGPTVKSNQQAHEKLRYTHYRVVAVVVVGGGGVVHVAVAVVVEVILVFVGMCGLLLGLLWLVVLLVVCK